MNSMISPDLARWKRHVLILCLGMLTLAVVLHGRRTFSICFGQARALAQAAPKETALTGEPFKGALGQVPQDWFMTAPGFAARLVAEGAKPGRHAVVLTTDPAFTGQKSPFGVLMRGYDAMPYRGKKVRFRATVRFEGGVAAGQTQMWMRVDRPNQQVGFFDNMGDRPITDGAWKTYEIAGDVADDANSISIGLILIGSGKAYMDGVSFMVANDVPEPKWEAPHPLSEHGRDNLVAFTRLLGYVRHFYPGDEAIKTDWDHFALRGIRMAESAQDAAELANRMQSLCRTVAPAVQVFPTGQPPAAAPVLPVPDAKSPKTTLKVVRWLHHGFGQENKQSAYRSEREYRDAPNGAVPPGFNDPRAPYEADLGGGVSCRVPLALYVDSKGTLPRAAKRDAAEDEDTSLLSGNDRASRLATVALAWNVFQHFYPYFDVVKTDWPAALQAGLTSAAEDRDERAFLDTLRRLVAALHDGHGYVTHKSDTDYAQIPLLLTWVGENLVVAQTFGQDTGGIKPGDAITKIDGTPTAQAYMDTAVRISAATEQWKRYRALHDLTRGAVGTTVTLQVQRVSNPPFTATLKREAVQDRHENRPPPIAEVKPGIWYVDLDAPRANRKDFQAALPALAKAKGLIIDMRGYPNEVAMALLPHLATAPFISANWNIPRITNPDGRKMEFDTSHWEPAPPATPHFSAKTAFLTDGRAISYAESVMGIVENYKMGAIVGEPTAGTNGNVNPVKLPGGYSVSWTGMKVTKHDGSRHHGVGILPTVPVSRTIEGIAQGRDEMLEKAIETVSQ